MSSMASRYVVMSRGRGTFSVRAYDTPFARVSYIIDPWPGFSGFTHCRHTHCDHFIVWFAWRQAMIVKFAAALRR